MARDAPQAEKDVGYVEVSSFMPPEPPARTLAAVAVAPKDTGSIRYRAAISSEVILYSPATLGMYYLQSNGTEGRASIVSVNIVRQNGTSLGRGEAHASSRVRAPISWSAVDIAHRFYGRQ